MSWRDLMAGDVRTENVGERHTLAGWVARRRDHGGLIFVDLRDETGICQLVVNPERAPDAAKAAHAIRNEFVLQADGEVVARAPDAVNPNLPTGEVELQVDMLRVLATAPPLPFQLDEEGVDETLRLRYRWLDLRREKMQRNIRTRARAVSAIRREMEAAGFVDIETPIMGKPTPEGARRPPGKIVAFKGTIKIDSWDAKNRVARGEIVESLDAIERGAKVGPVGRRYYVVPPSASQVDVRARILTSLYPHVIMGRDQVVFIDRGANDGLKPGNRLFVVRHGDAWRRTLETASIMARSRIMMDAPERLDVVVTELEGDEESFPEEVIAELRVIRSHKYSSLALVTESREEIEPGDQAVTRKGM